MEETEIAMDSTPGYGNLQFTFHSNHQRQKVIGFGGAFTDASAIVLAEADEKVQEEILRAYFGDDGAGYSLCRVPIGGSDFSRKPYTYEDTEGNFSVHMDELLKLPMIRRAASMSSVPLTLLASPWSAPAWMKDSNSLVWGSLKVGQLQNWANYLERFITEYAARGVNISYITVQNEPDYSLGPLTRLIVWWNSMAFSPRSMSEFLGLALGPTMKSSHPHVKILAGDDQRSNIWEYLKASLDDENARHYVAGAGFHWYATAAFSWAFPWAPWAGIDYRRGWESVLQASASRADLDFISTEATEGFQNSERGPRFGEWLRLERYAYGIIRDMQAGSMGFIDWNLVLDHHGGPNWADNRCDAGILLLPN